MSSIPSPPVGFTNHRFTFNSHGISHCHLFLVGSFNHCFNLTPSGVPVRPFRVLPLSHPSWLVSSVIIWAPSIPLRYIRRLFQSHPPPQFCSFSHYFHPPVPDVLRSCSAISDNFIFLQGSYDEHRLQGRSQDSSPSDGADYYWRKSRCPSGWSMSNWCSRWKFKFSQLLSRTRGTRGLPHRAGCKCITGLPPAVCRYQLPVEEWRAPTVSPGYIQKCA